MNRSSHSTDIIRLSNGTCKHCFSSGYISCLKPLSLDGPSPSPESLLGKDSAGGLLTLESTNPADEHSKFRGWGDWETLRNEPLHSDILNGKIGDVWEQACSRFILEGATISEYTLSGKPSFRRRSLHQLTIIQAFYHQMASRRTGTQPNLYKYPFKI
jgi:hypothetical protein